MSKYNKATQKKYRQKNKEEIKAKQKIYRQNNKENINAKTEEGSKYFKIGSHYSSDSGWCEGYDTNGERNHEEYDKIFGAGNWTKTWIGELTPKEKTNFVCIYCLYDLDELTDLILI